MMFAKATEVGWLGGFSVKHEGTKVIHLRFADDTLIFLDANVEQMQFLKYNLLCFEFISGLRTNFEKSSIFGVGEVSNLAELASVLGCSHDTFPTIYLGLPLGARTLSTAIRDKVVEWCTA